MAHSLATSHDIPSVFKSSVSPCWSTPSVFKSSMSPCWNTREPPSDISVFFPSCPRCWPSLPLNEYFRLGRGTRTNHAPIQYRKRRRLVVCWFWNGWDIGTDLNTAWDMFYRTTKYRIIRTKCTTLVGWFCGICVTVHDFVGWFLAVIRPKSRVRALVATGLNPPLDTSYVDILLKIFIYVPLKYLRISRWTYSKW